jgi:hypothetical protein
MEAIMSIGAVIVLGVAISCFTVINGCAAVEPVPIAAPAPLPQPSISRSQPRLPKPKPLLSDREQLKRYFLQDSPNRLGR